MKNTFPYDFIRSAKDQGVEHIVCVPCSMHSHFIAASETMGIEYIAAVNEGDAVAISAGLSLAGKKSIVLSQNSGLGNMINAITSLIIPYNLDLFLLLTHRGNPTETDCEQHVFMGSITLDLLLLLKIQVLNCAIDRSQLTDFFRSGRNCVLVSRSSTKNWGDLAIRSYAKTKNLFDSDIPLTKVNPDQIHFDNNQELFPLPSCKDAIASVFESLKNTDAIYVTTTGYIGRLVFQNHDASNVFYMSGSMGHAAGIGLGLSLATSKLVVVLDGDGALMMRLGIMANIGQYGTDNLFHVVLNNSCYASTGGQPSSAAGINFSGIAESCNYQSYSFLDDFIGSRKQSGPTRPGFIEIRINELRDSGERPSMPLEVIGSRIRSHLTDVAQP